MDSGSLGSCIWGPLGKATVVLIALASSIYMGARDEARDLALTLARACSPTSARS